MSKQKPLTLAAIINGFLLHAESKRLSSHTIDSYNYAFNKLRASVDEQTPLTAITIADLSAFLAAQDTLSNKTLSNIHAAISSMWNWAVRMGYTEANPMLSIDRPRPEEREIVPLAKEQVVALLKACEQTRSYTRPGKGECANSRPTVLRDKAIILALVDTGMRASELCDLTGADYNEKQRYMVVMGKRRKERMLPLSATTAHAIWHYLATRAAEMTTADPLFATQNGGPLDRQQLRHLLDRLGKRAGVPNVHPHKFRHTFAINFLRNRGDIYSLQRLLGHTTLDMVKRYLSIAQADVEAAHQVASPVSNWKL